MTTGTTRLPVLNAMASSVGKSCGFTTATLNRVASERIGRNSLSSASFRFTSATAFGSGTISPDA